MLPLDWMDPATYGAVQPPFDYVVAADCVYSEAAVPHFLGALKAMSTRKTRIIVTNEFRSASVHDEFLKECKRLELGLRKIPSSKLDEAYEHPSIHIYVLTHKK